jgi:hypothetical protein
VNPTNKQLADRLEARIAMDIGGRVMPASGSRWGARRDIKSTKWLVEAKTTKQVYHRIISRDLEFLQKQAYGIGLTPAFVVEFQREGLVALIPNDVMWGEGDVLVDRTDMGGWAFSYIEVESIKIPLIVRFDLGCYAAIPYEQFLEIDRNFLP